MLAIALDYAQGRLSLMNKSNHQSQVLCKYLRLTECGEDGPERKVRLAPFTEGTFRATQPSALNDVLSETKCLAYFNEFSPSDLLVTKKQLQQLNSAGGEPSDDCVLRDLKGSYNFPRMTPDVVPGLFDGAKISKHDFQYSEFLRAITAINTNIIKSISQRFGVLSLAQNCLEPLMWCHYSENGRGVCIEFDPENTYFNQNKPELVSYNPDARLHFSYFEGTMRINGIPIKHSLSAQGQELQLLEHWSKYFSEAQLKQAILYSKNECWSYENEIRISYKLSTCKLVRAKKRQFFNRSNGIFCAEIPFSAFKNVYLGYAISSEDREAVINTIRQNSELSHVTVFDVYPCPSGVLKTSVASLATTPNIES